jgi:hypothetical protein
MNYDNCEHEYMELQSQYNQERMLEPTEAHDKGYLLVDDNQVEEPIGFRSVDGAVEYATDIWGYGDDFSVYQLKKVL